MNASRLLWVPVLMLCLAHGRAVAQSGVEPRIEKLEEAVRVLERRVATLEEQLRQRSSTSGVPPDKANWRRLERGLSQPEVEKLLGSPTKVDAFGSFTVWHYGYPSGGRVQFDGRSQTVSGWQEPRE